MRSTLKLVFGAIFALAVPASSAEPVRIGDPDKFSAEIVETISKKRSRDVAGMIANTVGKPDSSETLLRLLQVFEGRSLDFAKKVIDKDYNGALRQIVYYSYLEGLGFVYFRFNFKMTSTGWVLANFSFKDETNELFPKDFTER
ncbi:MAG: hypothetical protein ACJ8FA_19535 [Xanthobacteraceae bacterium]